MGMLTRFSDILKANINELLDRCEDPEKMVDQYLRNAMDDLAEVKRETAAVMAEEKRCKRLMDDAKAEVDRYMNLASRAVAAGNDDDARVLLGRKQKAAAAYETAKATYETAFSNAEKMREMHDKLVSDIEALRTRKANIKATMAVAKTQSRMTRANDAMTGARGSLAAFDRMEEKAQRMLDESTAAAELDADPYDPADALEEKYGSGSDSAVEDELAQLKASLGQ